MIDNKELFDLSDYPEDHFCHDNSNKKVIGKFKDETNSILDDGISSYSYGHYKI
jgi:hypothetical protein